MVISNKMVDDYIKSERLKISKIMLSIEQQQNGRQLKKGVLFDSSLQLYISPKNQYQKILTVDFMEK